MSAPPSPAYARVKIHTHTHIAVAIGFSSSAMRATWRLTHTHRHTHTRAHTHTHTRLVGKHWHLAGHPCKREAYMDRECYVEFAYSSLHGVSMRVRQTHKDVEANSEGRNDAKVPPHVAR